LGLLTLIVVAGGFIVIVALPDLARTDASQASPSPSAQPSAVAQFMTWVTMPADADCAACHATGGGAIGLRIVPLVAHPISGWTSCTSCHANDRLVATAPGHSGIHATDCLLCHQPAQLPAPLSRPHRERQNQACLECHNGTTAPLPSDMQHRSETVCWLCHRLPQEEPPVPSHAVSAGEVDCLTCHIAGSAGALPADHSERTAGQCLLCHGPQPTVIPSSPGAATTSPP
jgi:hypothetical protein